MSAPRPIGFKPWEISAIINTEVVEQHVSDAAFLWTQRDRAVVSPHYRLRELARLDERVEAHLDAVRAAAETGWKFALEAAGKESNGSLFVAATLAFCARSQQRIRPIVALAVANPALWRQVVSAIGWVRLKDAAQALEWLIRSSQPVLRSLALHGYRMHRLDPGEPLRRALLEVHPAERLSAIRTACTLGRTDLAHIIARSLATADDSQRFYAALACVRLGLRDQDVLAALRALAEADSPYGERAMHMALRSMRSYEANAWLDTLLRTPKLLRRAITGIGAFGDPQWINSLLNFMRVEGFARIAGESFVMITGVDLKYDDLNQDKPECFDVGPNDDPDDPNVQMDADEDLPWPNHTLVDAWWHKHGHNFQAAQRYLLGKPILAHPSPSQSSPDTSLRHALKTGFQRQRTATAIELALLSPSQVLFDTFRQGKLQEKEIAIWSS